MTFQLPMVHSNVTLADAFAETIDARSSGLLWQPARGGLHLIHFGRMVNAAAAGIKVLDGVEWEPVLDLTRIAAPDYETFIRSANHKFGFVDTYAGSARLFSISEGYAGPYIAASSGARCQRPGKPATVPSRQWYHYYPPNARDFANPTTCRICGAPLP
jgi:hypothetical protein